MGWFDAEVDGTKVESIILGTIEDMTLYARWETLGNTITYENLYGTTHSNPETFNIETPTISLLAPAERTGYTFVGWFNAAEEGDLVSTITQGSTGHKIVFARWECKGYTITYNSGWEVHVIRILVTYE